MKTMERRSKAIVPAFVLAAGALLAFFFLDFDFDGRTPKPAAEGGPAVFRKTIDDGPLLVSPRPKDLVSDEPAAVPALPLRRGDDFRGVVVTAAGDPVPRVRVALAVHAPESRDGGGGGVAWFDGSRMRVVESTETGADGRFSLSAPGFDERAATVFLVADSPSNFVPERVADPPRGVEVVITLRPGGVVTGVVRADETGGPLPEATVRVRSRVLGAAGFEEDEDVVRTDETGRYRVDHFVGEPTEFATRYALDAEWRAFPVEMLPIEQGETVTRDLSISIAPFVAGTVLDAATGAPVAGALVELAGPYARDFRTGADGRFVLPRVEPREGDVAPEWFVRGGPRRLTVSAPGYLGASMRLGTAGDADRTALEVRLSKGVRVAGRVRDAAGRPRAARVEVAYKGRVLAFERSGADGTFAMDGVPPVRSASLRARESEEKGAGATLLDLDLTSDRTLDVALSDPGTAGVAVEWRAPLSREPVEREGFLPLLPLRLPIRLHGARHPETILVRSGIDAPPEASIAEGLLAGEYWADFGWEDASQTVRRAWVPVTVDAGRIVTVSEPEPGAGRGALPGLVAWVSGRAVDSLGNPLEDFEAALRGGGGRALGADECPWLAVDAGGFELEVPAGEPFAIVIASGGSERVIERNALAPGGHASLGEVKVPEGD